MFKKTYAIFLRFAYDPGEVVNVAFSIRILKENSGDVLLGEVRLQNVLKKIQKRFIQGVSLILIVLRCKIFGQKISKFLNTKLFFIVNFRTFYVV